MGIDSLKIMNRVRLARNISGMPFPHMLDDRKAQEVIGMTEDAFFVSNHLKDNFVSKRIKNEAGIKLLSYFEKHLVSSKLINNSDKSAFISNKDENISIMINEEDHLRIQAMDPEKNLMELYHEADMYDDLLSEKLKWAFDVNLGYITACPTNIGTALRASVMVHLPCLTGNDKIGLVSRKLAQMGMTIRGIYGEGSQAEGNIYQISNEVTLGFKEETIIKNSEETVNRVLEMEKEEQEKILNMYYHESLDRVYRSLATLSGARIMTSKESLVLLSMVRFGIESGILKEMTVKDIDELILMTQPGNLQVGMEIREMLPERDRDLLRATLLRQELEKRRKINA